MWRMLQPGTPQDYVVGSGKTHSVRELVELAFSHVGLDYRAFVVSDPKYFRPAEVDVLLADATRARRELAWSPKVGFAELVTMMVDADLERLSSGNPVASVRGGR
jgi:GDPmannose 4,6-dehydratase